MVVGAVGWRDRLLETAPVPNRFLPCFRPVTKSCGEEEKEKEAAAYSRTRRAIHVYMYAKTSGWLAFLFGVAWQSIDRIPINRIFPLFSIINFFNHVYAYAYSSKQVRK